MNINDLTAYINSLNSTITSEQTNKIIEYADLINIYNQKFNLTGLQNIKDIIRTLIIESINPIINLNVPRGTFFIDMGAGAGIPGIPIAIYYPDFFGYLIDSNNKKIQFLDIVKKKLALRNITPLCLRLENAGRSNQFREKIQWVFSRATGNTFYNLELGAPFLAIGGFLYIYSEKNITALDVKTLKHAADLGLAAVENNTIDGMKIMNGLLFKKIEPLSIQFPRRNSVIIRESKRKNN